MISAIVFYMAVLACLHMVVEAQLGWTTSQFVGSISGTSGSTDGSVTSATLTGPSGFLMESNDDFYVTDQNGFRIRKVTAAGAVSLFAGTGQATPFVNGQRTTATFSTPDGMTKDSSGNIFVADWGNQRVRKIDTSGVVSTFVGDGTPNTNLDGTGVNARITFPIALETASNGNMLVGQQNGYIRIITPAAVVTTLVGHPSATNLEGAGTTVKLGSFYGLEFDTNGDTYTSDFAGHHIRKIDSAQQVSLIVGLPVSGYVDGTGTTSRFFNPRNLKFGPDGLLYIADSNNHKIRSLNVTTREVKTVLGSSSGNVDGVGTNAKLIRPWGLAFNSVGEMLIAEFTGNRIRKAIWNCAPGYYFDSVTCVPCSSGYVKVGYNFLTSCTQCAIGTEAASDQTCSACSSGYYRPDLISATCSACPANGICSTIALTGCNIGFELNQAQTSCVTCTSGYYRPDLNSATCSACPANGICSASAFTGCSSGYQLNPSQTACEAIPPSSGETAGQTAAESSNGGAIAGGVIGGFSFIGLVFAVAEYGQKYIFGKKKEEEKDLEKGMPVDPTAPSTSAAPGNAF